MMAENVVVCPVEGAIVVYTVNDLAKGVLLTGSSCATLAGRLIDDGARLSAQGALTLRLGVALYAPPFLFVPHSVIDERGAVFQGEIVFDWLRAMAYDMPRSEVFGVNARGRDDQVFARDIDLESSPIVVGGPDESPVYVAARVGATELPPRFVAALKACLSPDPLLVRKVIESA